LKRGSALRRTSDLAAEREPGRLAGLALTTKAPNGTARLAVGKDNAAISRSIAGRSSQAAATPLH